MPQLTLQLAQKTKLSQLQRLTIQLLTMQAQEVTAFLEKEVTENPLLEIHYHDLSAAASSEKPISNLSARADSLETSLMRQLRLQKVERTLLLAAGLIIRNLDEKGFFVADLDELGQDYGLSLAEMEQGLALVQSFEPPGIAARNIREAYLIQARQKKNVPPGTLELLAHYYQDFLQGKWSRLCQSLHLSVAGLEAIRQFLATLSLQPAAQREMENVYVRPVVEIFFTAQQKLTFRFLEELPTVTFRSDLYQTYAQSADKKTRTYIHRAKRNFADLQMALAYRRQSMQAVFTSLLTWQADWFSGGDLKPFLQKELAVKAGLSQATVSRICHHQYVLFRGKNYSLKFFFSRNYGANDAETQSFSVVEQAIREIIASENKQQPYSDSEISRLLAQRKIILARRTVVKFRQQLNIPNSRLRREIK